MRKTLMLLALTTLSAAALPAATLEQAVAKVTATGAYTTVERLASPEYAGRLTGTAGYDAAASWVASQLEAAGLKPVPEAPGFFQRFPATVTGVSAADLEVLPAGDGAQPVTLRFFKDFLPMLYSGTGDVTAEVVFVGYGITAPGLARDDYAGLDVRGKVVLALRGAPKDGRDWKAYDSHRARTANAAAHGAAGYLFAESAVANPNGAPIEGLPMATVSVEVADGLLAGRDLSVKDLRKVLEAGGVVSFATGRKVHMAVTSVPARAGEGRNVIAVLPGSDPALAKEYVIVGAHLDHCGDWPDLLPGADDNASGSATVLEVARAAATLRPRPKRSIVFAFFAGEEEGLLGSKYLAAHLPASLGRCVGVFNLDMVGVGNGAFVASGKNFPALFALLEQARDREAPGAPLRAGLSQGEARADHGSFQEAGIPAVSLFGMGGEHHGYHTDADTLWFITPKSMEGIGRIVLDAAVHAADAS